MLAMSAASSGVTGSRSAVLARTCVNGPLSISTARERFLGYQKGLERHGLPFEQEIVSDGSYKTEGGYRQMQRLLAAGSPPGAIIAANTGINAKTANSATR